MAGKYAVAAIVMGLVILVIGWAGSECEKAGGVPVRTLFAYKCLNVEEIK